MKRQIRAKLDFLAEMTGYLNYAVGSALLAASAIYGLVMRSAVCA